MFEMIDNYWSHWLGTKNLYINYKTIAFFVNLYMKIELIHAQLLITSQNM